MNATDENAVSTALSEVRAAIGCLGLLESSWPGAKKCHEILKELVDLTLQKLQDGMPSLPVVRRTSLGDQSVIDGSTIRSPARSLMQTIHPMPVSPFLGGFGEMASLAPVARCFAYMIDYFSWFSMQPLYEANHRHLGW
jgi:hypothetical protein